MWQEAHGPHQEAEEEEEGGSRQREARRGQDPPQEHGTLIMNEHRASFPSSSPVNHDIQPT